MHGGRHRHGNGRQHHEDHDHHHDPGPGHNHAPDPKGVAQWQTPHLQDGQAARPEEADLDLVERAFVEGFAAASDPTSFLWLAQVPFAATDADGNRLVLLRVETDAATDVGSVTPHLGGASFRYEALPARMTSRRSRLRLIYFDGAQARPLSLAEARGLGKP